jgi:hypothetical protein
VLKLINNFINIYPINEYGDWGLGIGDWGLGIGPNPQSPIPNPQSPIPNPHIHLKYYLIIIKIIKIS